MKATALFAAALLAASPALAFDLKETTYRLDAANYSCMSGENHDGEKISESATKEACIDTIMLLREMSANGYCYAKDKFEWRKCAS